MTPRAWIRYWSVGWVLGPVIAVYGVATSDAVLADLGVVLLVVALAMTVFWRRRSEGQAPPR